jgi:hypothetical protein
MRHKRERSLWIRIITGDGMRRTRLHTYSGKRVDLRGLLDLPRSAWSAILLKGLGHRQPVPWLGYRAVRRLRSIVQPDSLVLEFGSGMSSLFFARRCARLVSIESNAAWYDAMNKRFASERLTNIDYRLRDSGEDYVSLEDLPDRSFDLVVNDGIARDQVSKVALRKVKLGGYIFLDNSDVPYPEFQQARQVLLEVARSGGVWFFNDFHPFQVQVNESLLVQITQKLGNEH